VFIKKYLIHTCQFILQIKTMYNHTRYIYIYMYIYVCIDNILKKNKTHTHTHTQVCKLKFV
jgi:hypothetical protein